MSLDNALQELVYEQSLKEQAEQARRDGRISEAEYSYFMKRELGVKTKPKPPIAERRKSVAAKIGFAMILMFGILGSLSIFIGGGPGDALTGHLTYTQEANTLPVELLFTEDGAYALNMTNITGLSVTGTGTGTGKILLINGAEELLVHEFTAEAERYSVRTEKESYALNETMNVTVMPANASSTLWLTDEMGEKRLLVEPYTTSAPGAYALDALINDSGRITKVSTAFLVRNDTNSSKDILREAEAAASVTFTEACEESCNFNSSGNLSLRIETIGSVTITSIITTTPVENQAPIQLLDLDPVIIQMDESATIDLDEYFLDGNGEALTYDFMNVDNAEVSVSGSILTITGLSAGERQSVIYASDLNELIQSNTFTITVLGGDAGDDNGTLNGTGTSSPVIIEVTNGTANETSNGTIEKVPKGLCTHPDPNKRPVECIQEGQQYFLPQEVAIENDNLQMVGKLTPIGNLLIKGRVHEYASFTPTPGDFAITYRDSLDKSIATVWLETSTGDLWLRGALIEENGNLQPPPNSYVIQNKRGITLMWVDRTRGELHVRGNVITGRGELE